MQQVFESIYDLEKYLSQNLEKVMGTVSKEIEKDLKKNYKDDWYGRDTDGQTYDTQSKSYKRTKQLLKGIEIKTSHNLIAGYNISNFTSIGFYGTKITPKLDKKRFFNAYMSLNHAEAYGGMYITEAIAWWIEKGTSSPYYSMPAKHIFQKTAKKYNRDKVETRIKNLLKRQGIGFL